MKLYIFPPSPNSLRVQAVANQLGMGMELVPVDLPQGEHLQEWFVALNPNHKIPTLVDGDVVVWDSMAIMLYLAEKAPTGGPIPAQAGQRAHMYQWLGWNLGEWGPQCGTLIFERFVKGVLNMGAPDPAAIGAAEEQFHRYAQVLNGHLQGRGWLVGDGITLADHAVGSWLVHAERAQYPLGDYAEIQRWWTALSGTDAWQQALSVMS